jgi:anti-anti-sigma regulatory factor/anti-sigma regulatory factor (Ser/Thr protein kinase)
MNSQLALSVEGGSTDPVVSLAGALDAGNVQSVAKRLAKVLAEDPRSLTIDMSGITHADRTSLTVFVLVSHHAAAWPGCPLVFCGARGAVRTGLANLGVTRFVSMAQDRAEAARLLRETPAQWRFRERLLPSLHSVELARLRARNVCMQWGAPSLSEAAETVATELVTNSAQHAGSPIDLAFALSERFLYVSVRDRNPDPPRLRYDDDLEAYGLRLVEAFSAHWGHARSGPGKVVWAALRRLRYEAEPPPPLRF